MKCLLETLCKEKGISLNELYYKASVNENPVKKDEKIIRNSLGHAKETKKITIKGDQEIQKEILFLEKQKEV